MKHLLIMLVAILPLMTIAQIEESTKMETTVDIGKIKSGPYTLAEIILHPAQNDHDSLFVLVFKDARYTTITEFESIGFYGGMNELELLRKNFMQAFVEENVKNKDWGLTFKLGKSNIMIISHKFFGTTSMYCYVDDRAYMTLTEKQVNKLFGK